MLETAWESRWLPDLYGGVAQLGEHLPCKQGVMSSNLTISTLALSHAKLKGGRPSSSLDRAWWISILDGASRDEIDAKHL